MKKVSIKNKVNTKIESGITLIALVVTIIVLLLLAGISIQMLTGDNGILKRAAEAKEETEIQQIIENAKLDIINGIITGEDIETILTSKYGTLSTEGNTKDKILTTTDGKYQIPVSKIYDGVFSDDKLARYKNEVDLYFVDKLAEAEIINQNALKLQEFFNKGPAVIYNYSTYTYNDIEPILDASTAIRIIPGDSNSTIVEYHNIQYRLVYDNSTGQVISSYPINNENLNVADKAEIRKIIPDITDDYLDKLVIQNGKLAYYPDKVTESEKSSMENIGIFAMTLTTIIFIANGVEYSR